MDPMAIEMLCESEQVHPTRRISCDLAVRRFVIASSFTRYIRLLNHALPLGILLSLIDCSLK